MDWSIAFDCPDCRTRVSIPLLQISPGRPRHCPACRSLLQLTPRALQELREQLADLPTPQRPAAQRPDPERASEPRSLLAAARQPAEQHP